MQIQMQVCIIWIRYLWSSWWAGANCLLAWAPKVNLRGSARSLSRPSENAKNSIEGEGFPFQKYRDFVNIFIAFYRELWFSAVCFYFIFICTVPKPTCCCFFIVAVAAAVVVNLFYIVIFVKTI